MHKSKSAKILSLLLCLVMALGTLPWQALAAELQTGGSSGLERVIPSAGPRTT